MSDDGNGSAAGAARVLTRGEKQARSHALVREAVKKGTLQQEPCELCGDPVTVAHHDDYDKPLDVRWLCGSHHTLVHKALNVGREVSPVTPTQMTARTFRDRLTSVERPTMIVRQVDGEYVKLGLWIPARAMEG